MSDTAASKARKLLFFGLSQGPKGLCVRDLTGPKESPKNVAQTLHFLRDQGLIFGVETAWREVRWFDSQARADAYLAANPLTRVGREAKKDARRQAGPAGTSAPAVNAGQVKVQVLPGFTGAPRWELIGKTWR